MVELGAELRAPLTLHNGDGPAVTVSTFTACTTMSVHLPALTPHQRYTPSRNLFPRRAMHHGCVAAPTKAGGKRRVVADIAKLTIGREEYYTRELATDHQAYCPATASPQAGGTALAPPCWGCRAKHRG